MKSNSNDFCKKNIILENSLNAAYKKNCKPFLISSFLGASLLIGSAVGTAQAGIFGSLFASNDSEETSSNLRTRLQTKRD